MGAEIRVRNLYDREDADSTLKEYLDYARGVSSHPNSEGKFQFNTHLYYLSESSQKHTVSMPKTFSVLSNGPIGCLPLFHPGLCPTL